MVAPSESRHPSVSLDGPPAPHSTALLARPSTVPLRLTPSPPAAERVDVDGVPLGGGTEGVHEGRSCRAVAGDSVAAVRSAAADAARRSETGEATEDPPSTWPDDDITTYDARRTSRC